MDSAKQELVAKLKASNNILVTVSRDPSVDQLSALLGLALFLNKQGKHTAAVFSGEVPSTLEFLQPEDTLEKNTDSLRDFIIALDKSKADKLRYKVEDNVVRIFITPYKTSIGQDDLDFSQGDFNVDVVVALGVSRQEDLDEAITAHGRILHDATVASINLSPEGGLGSINWQDPRASSLSELVTSLANELDPGLLDGQIATALLTGIVSATDRFSNDKTSSQTMSASAALMTAGANQQLVASKLEEPASEPPVQQIDEVPAEDGAPAGEPEKDSPNDDGTIEIEHDNNEKIEVPVEDEMPQNPAIDLPPPEDSPAPTDMDDAAPAAEGSDVPPAASPDEASSIMTSGSKILTGPPTLGGTLTANSQPEALDPATDPMSVPSSEPPQMLERKPETQIDFTPPPTEWTAPATPSQPLTAADPIQTLPDPIPAAPTTDFPPPPADPSPTLSDLEENVKTSEQQATGEAAGLDTARDEVNRALNTAESTLPPKPIEALNAQPLSGDLHPNLQDILANNPPAPSSSPLNQPQTDDSKQVVDPMAPPPVPPPIPFQFGNTNPPQQ